MSILERFDVYLLQRAINEDPLGVKEPLEKCEQTFEQLKIQVAQTEKSAERFSALPIIKYGGLSRNT